MNRSFVCVLAGLVLCLLSISLARADDDSPIRKWQVPGFTAEVYRHLLPDGEGAAGLRFRDPAGRIVARFPGKGDTEAWALITDAIHLPEVPEPIAAFMHYSGGIHCCSAVELFRLGPTPSAFAATPRQEGDGATVVATGSGWVAPSHDRSFAYGFDRSFAHSAFPPVYWRLTPAGFVTAPELQKAGEDGLPALFGQCRLAGRDGDGNPTCDSYAVQPMTDQALTAAIKAVVASAGGNVDLILRDLPAQAIEGIAEGRGALIFAALDKAGAPPLVARKLVQSYAARPYWPEILALNGIETMLTPLAADGHAVGAAIAGDRALRPLGLYGGPTLGFVDLACNGDGHLRLLDAFGGGLGELTMIGCPRLTVPQAMLTDGTWSGAAVATGENGGRGIVALTAQGGLVVPLDDDTIEVAGFTDEDKDGKAETVELTAGERRGSCPLTDVAAAMGCIDQFQTAE
jgi:hypothetical protein